MSMVMCFSHAQAVNFEGLSVQAAVGIQQQTVKVSGLGINGTAYKLPNQRYDNTAVPFYLSAGYAAAVTPNLTLGAIVEYSPISNQVGISVVPGYALTDQTQAYLKLGWVYSPTTVDQGPGRSDSSEYLNGGLVGAGVKMLVTKNIYVYAELNYIRFASMRFGSWYGSMPINGYANVDAYNLMAGLGYRF